MRIPTLVATAALVISFQLPASAGSCPSVVTAAALKAHAAATVSSCKKEQENGKTEYEVMLATTDGRKMSLDVDPGGKILMTEEHVALTEVPPAVITALNAKYADAKPTRAEMQTAADGKITYELAFSAGSKKKEATFTAAGSFVEEED